MFLLPQLKYSLWQDILGTIALAQYASFVFLFVPLSRADSPSSSPQGDQTLRSLRSCSAQAGLWARHERRCSSRLPFLSSRSLSFLLSSRLSSICKTKLIKLRFFSPQMGFSNGGLHVVLQTSALAAWKRTSLADGTFSPAVLVSRGLDIQANINNQWLPFNQPSNPLLPYKLALFQIHREFLDSRRSF